MTESPRCRCFTKPRRFLPRTLTVWLTGNVLKIIYALSFLIKLQDGRVIRRHQDHMWARLCSSELISPTPVNNPGPEQIATTTRHITSSPYSHSRHRNASESSGPEINCCDVNSIATIFPRSRSTTINCCDVNPMATICSRNQGTRTFQSWIKFELEARNHK